MKNIVIMLKAYFFLRPFQCCGNTPYGLAQDGVLCCKNVLYNGTEDGEECSVSGIPYKPFAETMCASKRHKTPGGHCCGEELYQPNRTICCKGQRWIMKLCCVMLNWIYTLYSWSLCWDFLQSWCLGVFKQVKFTCFWVSMRKGEKINKYLDRSGPENSLVANSHNVWETTDIPASSLVPYDSLFPF